MNYKNCVIISLCPIPNFIVLFYYLISIKILVEEKNLHQCHNLQSFSVYSYVWMIISNIYLAVQLCYDKPRLFMNDMDGHFIFQILWYSALVIILVIGLVWIVESKSCLDESQNIYYLSVSNIIIELIIWIVITILIIYYSLFTPKIQPLNHSIEHLI